MKHYRVEFFRYEQREPGALFAFHCSGIVSCDLDQLRVTSIRELFDYTHRIALIVCEETSPEYALSQIDFLKPRLGRFGEEHVVTLSLEQSAFGQCDARIGPGPHSVRIIYNAHPAGSGPKTFSIAPSGKWRP